VTEQFGKLSLCIGKLAAWLLQFSLYHTLPPLPIRLRRPAAYQLPQQETPHKGA